MAVIVRRPMALLSGLRRAKRRTESVGAISSGEYTRSASRSKSSLSGTLPGVQARFFQLSIFDAISRGGQRFTSTLCNSSSCLSKRSWSSVSRMVKLDFSPASSAWRRRILTLIEWKVPIHRNGSPSLKGVLASRSFISRAALLVKVTASISRSRARPVSTKWAIRAISVLVLPVPAPASISSGPSSVSAASRCAGFRSSRWAVPRGPTPDPRAPAIARCDRLCGTAAAAPSKASSSSNRLMRAL